MVILIGHLNQSESSMKTPKKRKEILAISIELNWYIKLWQGIKIPALHILDINVEKNRNQIVSRFLYWKKNIIVLFVLHEHGCIDNINTCDCRGYWVVSNAFEKNISINKLNEKFPV